MAQIVGYKPPELAPNEKKPSLQQFLSKPIPHAINLDLVLTVLSQQLQSNQLNFSGDASNANFEEEKRQAQSLSEVKRGVPQSKSNGMPPLNLAS